MVKKLKALIKPPTLWEKAEAWFVEYHYWVCYPLIATVFLFLGYYSYYYRIAY